MLNNLGPFLMNSKLMPLDGSRDIKERLQSAPECSRAPYMMLFGLLGEPEQNPGPGAKGVFADVSALTCVRENPHCVTTQRYVAAR